MHSGSRALGGAQTDFSGVRGGRSASKAAPEPNTDRRNLRSRGPHELGPVAPQNLIGPDWWVVLIACG